MYNYIIYIHIFCMFYVRVITHLYHSHYSFGLHICTYRHHFNFYKLKIHLLVEIHSSFNDSKRNSIIFRISVYLLLI